jgi:hypothetical protein
MLALVAAVVTLFGTVTRGPVTPVCEAHTPCDAPAGGATLTFTRGPVSVRTRTTDAGRYRVRLAPGTYTVRANTGVRVAPATVLVRGTTMRRDFAIDTGIR